MRVWQRRAPYVVGAVVVMALGLASRHYSMHLPTFVAEYVGDVLWALMVFLGISAVVPDVRVHQRGGMALAFACIVELSQLYHAPWIDALRSTTLGGLVLGFGFLWTDFVCYATGVLIGVVAEYALKAGSS